MKTAAILTGPHTHLDHLGVLSSMLKIPLVVTEEEHAHFAKEFYPDLQPELKGMKELTAEYLAQNYDMIFQSGKFFAAELKPLIELLFQKQMRFVFCPHGNSDKGHSLKEHVEQDISLVYGDHLRDLQHQNGAAKKVRHFVKTGNYRYTYYLQRQTFFDALAEEKVFSRFPQKKPVILYAPTWSDKENPTSFFTAIDRIIEELSGSYNLLIKLHPFLIDDQPAHVYSVMGRYENDPSVLFLTNFPPIYPLLERCALYLGDYSSIGYDFLVYDRPLYFLNPNKAFSLQSCGLELPEVGIKAFIDSTLERDFSEQRKKIYYYAFGEEIPPETLRKNIFNLLQT